MKRLHVAIGIVVRAGEVLICRRKSDGPFGGYWEFPGGKCEPGEAPANAVVRELLEELAIGVTAVRSLPRIEHQYDAAHVTLHPFVCRLHAGEPRAISAAECRWVAGNELARYRFPEANAPLLAALVAGGAIDLAGGDA